MFSRLRIRKKLALYSAALIVATLVVASVGIIGTLLMNHEYQEILQVSINNTNIRRMVEKHLDIRGNIRQAALFLDEEKTVLQCLTAIEDAAGDLDELMSTVEVSLVTDQAKEKFAPLVAMHEELEVGRQQAVSLIRSRDREGLHRWLGSAALDVDRFHATAQELGDLAQSLVVETSASADQKVVGLVTVSCLIGAAAILTAVAVTRRLNRRISLPLIDMALAAEKIAVGDMDIHLDSLGGDEIGQLSKAFHKMIQAMREQIRALEAVANGDLTVTVEQRSANDYLNRSLAAMLETNSNMVRQIQSTAGQVRTGAVQISRMAQVLASSSMEQAAGIEQFSSALDEIYNKTKSHMENAEWAVSASNQTQQLADRSLDNMHRSRQAMEDIEKGADNIAVMTQAINDIAFQTNILALNAAVEAAHAGSHGKGFAVVADEVRILASKSAAAAQETASLIGSSIESVKLGRESVEQTGAGMQEMQQYSLKSLQLIQDIAGSSVEQKNTMDEISRTIQQISRVISEVSANAEETAAASEKLSDQSRVLDELVSKYKVAGTAPRQTQWDGDGENATENWEAFSL